MSTLLKWAQNTQGKLNGNKNGVNGDRKWIHPPEALQKGHIAYLVKFLGNSVVDQPKGIEVVKEAIRKLRFSQQLRKSETGAKTKKVELTISVDGVAIQEPRVHTILHQFPLHQISYCADDKGEKKFFSFIAKQPNQEDSDAEDKHECFVFISDKLAEEITLTIGQAFELAYRRFLDTSGKDLESQRKAMVTQQKIRRLEYENNVYKQRLMDIAQIRSIAGELDQYLRKNNIKSLVEVKSTSNSVMNVVDSDSGNNGLIMVSANSVVKDATDATDRNGGVPPVPPRSFENTPAVGTKLEGLLLNELEQDNSFDPRSFENQPHNEPILDLPPIAPPPKAARRNMLAINTNAGSEPVKKLGNEDLLENHFAPSPTVTTPSSLISVKSDPFEMGDFNNSLTTPQEIENAIGLLDKRIMEMKTGFSRGISFGNDDFSLESLDPLKN